MMRPPEPERRRDELADDWQERDALESYNLAVREIGKRVRAGEPLPAFFQPGEGAP